MNEQVFLRLLRFYLACIEAEDRRSLTKKLSALHHSVVSPWDEHEPFFHSEATEVPVEVKQSSDQKVLFGNTAFAGSAERLFYGYPLFLDEEGFLAPLFFAEVEVEHQEGNLFVVRPVDPGEINLNHHIFQRQHAQPEELRAIQDELEGNYGSFADRLRAAFEMLGQELPAFPASPMDPYPEASSPRNRWVNRPILFKSERSSYTHHLRRELDDLAKYQRLLKALSETAAGTVAGLTPKASTRAAEKTPLPPPLLQVLPLNPSQEKAARSALEAHLTVITGPPGTGKSQVVVDLLASFAVAGRPVLFASKNNKAVDVVRDRLRSILGEDFDLSLRFGTKKVMQESRTEMEKRLDCLRPDKVPHAPSSEILLEVDQRVTAARERIQKLERAQAEYDRLERERRLAEGLVEKTWVELTKAGSYSLDLPRIETLSATAEALAGNGAAGCLLKIWQMLAPGFLKARVYSTLMTLSEPLPELIRSDLKATAWKPATNPFSPLAEACRKLACLARWRAAEDKCRAALEVVSSEEPADVIARELEDCLEQRAQLACDQLRADWAGRVASRAASIRHLLRRYFDLSERIRQSHTGTFLEILRDFKNTIQELSSDLPIWVVTNLSVRNAVPLEASLFDLVIIDEASQCDIPSAIPLLFRARRAVIIGDPHQLRHISTLPSNEEELLAREHGVTELLTTWSYCQRSLYALAEGVVLEKGQQPFFLAEHYRSHPDIIEFPNRTFYQGQLVLRTKLEKLRERLRGESPGVFWHDVKGTVSRSSRSAVNEAEVRAVVELLDEWARTGFLLNEKIDFGIVTPFRLQMQRLEEAVCARPWRQEVGQRLTVGTAHRFQGDERDVMIFSPVVAEGMRPRLIRWVAETDQLLNVAITRARAALHIVGDLMACLEAGGSLGKFAAAARDCSASRDMASLFESPAEMKMAELLQEAGLWFTPQCPVDRYRLDFLVITPLGTRYDVEVDGRGHLTDEATRHDEVRDAALKSAGLKVIRIDARRIFNEEDRVRELLRRLV